MEQNNKSILVMVRGLPGSGKSLLAMELRAHFGLSEVTVLDPDAIKFDSKEYTEFCAELKKQSVDEKLHPYRYLRAKAYGAIEARKIVVWNQAFTNADLLSRTILNLSNYAKEHAVALSSLVVEVQIDPNVAKERVKLREENGGHGVPDDAFNRFIDTYESFQEYGYPIIQVTGTDPLANSVDVVQAEIRRLRKQ
jgi:predicted ABC-type ATPase